MVSVGVVKSVVVAIIGGEYYESGEECKESGNSNYKGSM